MDLQQLACVVAVVDEGTFTRAAASLHVTQPALSYKIVQLERELDTRLFERTGRRVRLTETGRAVLEPARSTLAEAARAKNAVAAVNGLIAGRLTIALIRTETARAGRVIAAFHQRHPAVRLDVLDPGGDSVVTEQVRAGRADVGIVREPSAPRGLESLPIGTEQVVALVPATFPVGGSISLRQLADLPLIAPGPDSGRAAWDRLFDDEGATPNVVLESAHSTDLTIAMVRAGIGAALLTAPDQIAGVADLADARVVPLNPPRLATVAVIRRGGQPSPAAERFCALALELD